MKKINFKEAREAKRMLALVCATTVHLTGPQARAVDLTINSGTIPINSVMSYGFVYVASTTLSSGTLSVTTNGALTVGDTLFYIGRYGSGTLTMNGGTITSSGSTISFPRYRWFGCLKV